jgi:hypothetical protein
LPAAAFFERQQLSKIGIFPIVRAAPSCCALWRTVVASGFADDPVDLSF